MARKLLQSFRDKRIHYVDTWTMKKPPRVVTASKLKKIAGLSGSIREINL